MAKKTSDLSPDFEKLTANVMAAAKKELEAAARAHKVRIKTDQIVYGSFGNTTIVHAPLVGIEKYRDADFKAGAPIQLVIVKSTRKGEIPNGTYVVKAQHQPRATSGKAMFTDRTGTIVGKRDLIVRTVEQSAVLFPGVYSDPQNLPLVTSWHCFPKPSGDWAIDCAGWQPPRVLYY